MMVELAPRPREAVNATTILATLFPGRIVARERRASGDRTQLLPAEALCCVGFSEMRVAEFAAGRECARAALRAAGASAGPLLRRIDRRPKWPTGFVGSITHTHDFCGAVVASTGHVASIGIDAERANRLSPELWPHVLVGSERAWLEPLSPEQQQRFAIVMFSAKETFYKCQYPLTEQWIGFDEVAIDVHFEDSRSGTFRVEPVSPGCIERFAGRDLRGRFCFDGFLVVTGMYVPAQWTPW